MAEQEKKQEQDSYTEQLAKVMQSLKGTPLPTDTEPLREFIKVPDRFKKN